MGKLKKNVKGHGSGQDHWGYEQNRRSQGVEARRFLWIRQDIWKMVDERSKEKNITKAEVVNEALYNLLLRETMKEQYDRDITYQESVFHPDFGSKPKQKNKFLPVDYDNDIV